MKRIFLFSIIAAMSCNVSTASAQSLHKQETRKKQLFKDVTVGFRTGAISVFKSPVVYKSNPAWNNSLYLKKDVTDRISVETGVGYSKEIIDNAGVKRSLNTVSIPATAQYYLLPKNKKVRPYIGAGAAYNIVNTGFVNAPVNTDKQNCCLQNGTKYISLIVTQGILFEVNTKIQVNESVHFMPSNQITTLGIDLGIGYKL